MAAVQNIFRHVLARQRIWAAVSALIILSLSGLMAYLSSSEKSNTVDEIVHITGGYAYWTLNDYRLNPENGNIPQRIAALPHLYSGELPEIDVESKHWERSEQWHLAHELWFETGTDHQRVLHNSRVAMLLFNLSGLLVVFVISLTLWGRNGAILSLLVAGFSPSFLGHLSLATSDFAGAWTLLLATHLYGYMLEKPSPATILASGLSAGVAILCKHSGLLLGPVAFILLAMRLIWEKPFQLRPAASAPQCESRQRTVLLLIGASFLTALICWATIWTAYGWRFSAIHPDQGDFRQFLVPESHLPFQGLPRYLMLEVLMPLQILPQAFLYGLEFILSFDTRTNYLNGVYSNSGFPLYFPLSFLYKTPVPGILIHVTGWIVLLYLIFRRKLSPGYPLMGILLLFFSYSLLLVLSDMNIGYRHAFPALLCSCIIVGVLTSGRTPLPALAKSLIFILAISMIPLAWMSQNRNIAYMNAFGGGASHGYLHLKESSIDWGQDLPAIADLVNRIRKDHPDKRIYVAYAGSASPTAFGIEGVTFLLPLPKDIQYEQPPKLEPGVYIVGASAIRMPPGGWDLELEKIYQTLHSKVNERNTGQTADTDNQMGSMTQLVTAFEELRMARLSMLLETLKPDQVLHGSVLVYNLTEEELDSLSW